MFTNKKITVILLSLVILIQASYTTYLFATQKEGFFSDEAFSYGLANSYYKPYFSFPGDATSNPLMYYVDSENNIRLDTEQTGLSNCYHWISGSEAHNYLTVQSDQRFSYASVIYNQSLDLHPPFYYLLLHTICSLFPDAFSKWYAYCINLFCMVGIMIFLFLTARQISNSSVAALMVCLLYGGSAGALSTFLFLRQYSMLTLFLMIFTYFAVRLYQRRQLTIKENKLYYLAAVLSAFAAFMTHFYAIIYIGIFTALYCLSLLLEKKWKKMFFFGLGMLATLLFFFLLWPHLFSQSASYESALPTSYSTQTRTKMALSFLCRYCFGFSIDVMHTAFWNIVWPPVTALLVFIPLLLLPFRDEVWCQNLFARAKRFPRKAYLFLKQADYSTIFIALSALSFYPVVGVSVDIFRMEEFAIRYVVLTFPFLYLVVTLWIRKLLNRILRSKTIPDLLLCALILFTIIRTQLTTFSPFLMPSYGERENTAKLLEGKNVVWIYESSKDSAPNTNWSCVYLRDSENAFLVSADLLEFYMSDIEQLQGSIDYVILSSTLLSVTPEKIRNYEKFRSDFQKHPIVASSFMENAPEFAADSASTGITYQSSDAEHPSSLDCTDLLTSMNGGCDYEVLYGINVQDSLFYVVKLE